jgi:hypothetical protein
VWFNGEVKKATVYGELAARARSWGYAQVTASAVHDWRKRRLLPPVQVVRSGFGQRRTEIPDDVTQQLRAICKLRYDRNVDDLRVLGLLLWLDGWEQDLGDVRAGITAAATVVTRYLRKTGGRARGRDLDDPNADLDATISRLTPHQHALVRQFGGEAVDGAAFEVAVDEFFRGMTGRTPPDELDPDALAPVGIALGLGRAHSEAPAGEAPWLPELPGEALAEAIARMSEPAIARRLEQTSDHELVEARAIANDLARSLALVARFFELALPKGAYGLGMLGPFAADEPLGRIVAFLNALAIPTESRAAADAFRETTANLQALIDIGKAWLTEHPDYAEQAQERGLTPVIQEVLGTDRSP